MKCKSFESWQGHYFWLTMAETAGWHYSYYMTRYQSGFEFKYFTGIFMLIQHLCRSRINIWKHKSAIIFLFSCYLLIMYDKTFDFNLQSLKCAYSGCCRRYLYFGEISIINLVTLVQVVVGEGFEIGWFVCLQAYLNHHWSGLLHFCMRDRVHPSLCPPQRRSKSESGSEFMTQFPVIAPIYSIPPKARSS